MRHTQLRELDYNGNIRELVDKYLGDFAYQHIPGFKIDTYFLLEDNGESVKIILTQKILRLEAPGKVRLSVRSDSAERAKSKMEELVMLFGVKSEVLSR